MKKWYLKRKLKRIYIKLQTDYEYLDCGHSLACHMSRSYYNLCLKYNKTADKLSKLDSNCPKFRWKLD
jgi:hypothetical protein